MLLYMIVTLSPSLAEISGPEAGRVWFQFPTALPSSQKVRWIDPGSGIEFPLTEAARIVLEEIKGVVTATIRSIRRIDLEEFVLMETSLL